MSTIQEIAEELVNLTVKEVNELSMIIKDQEEDIAIQKYKMVNNTNKNYNSSPKNYGQSIIYKKHKRR